jgi:hypothetical protein
MEWLLTQAQTAGPFVAVFCLGVAAILWRQHIKDQRTIASMGSSMTRALTASARAMEKLAGKIENHRR